MSLLKSIRKANQTDRFNRLRSHQLYGGILAGGLAIIAHPSTRRAADDLTSPIVGVEATNALEVPNQEVEETRIPDKRTHASSRAMRWTPVYPVITPFYKAAATERFGTIELSASLAEQDSDVVLQ